MACVCVCVSVCVCVRALRRMTKAKGMFLECFFFKVGPNMEEWKNNLSTSYKGESGLRPVVTMENVFYSMKNVFYTDLTPP